MLNTIAHILITPMVWFVAGALLLVLAYVLSGSGNKDRSRGWLKLLSIAWVALFYLASTPWLPGKLAGWLETQYTVASVNGLQSRIGYAPEQTPVRIIVLGAGYHEDRELPEYMQLRESGLKRMLEGARLAKTLPEARVLTSGFSEYGTRPASEIVRHALVQQGIEVQRIDAQPEPRNTEQEAQWYAERFGTDETVILVTSAMHMRRSMAWFAHYGVTDLHAAPTDFHGFPEYSEGWHDFVPDHRHLDTLHKALREYVGYLLVR